MRLRHAIILLLLSGTSLHAEDRLIPASSVLSAVSGYQNGQYFRAILAQGKEDADLHVFSRDGWDMVPEAFAPGIAVTGIGGSDASLDTTEQGSLLVRSENIAIGRHRWQQTLTIVKRDGQFLVGGYTYSFYDTLEVDANGEVVTGNCDLNLLTGKGEKDGKSIRTRFKARPVSEWSADMSPSECSWN